MNKRILLFLLLVSWIPLSDTAAVTVKDWSASTSRDFATGELDGTALDHEGRIVLAPKIDTLWGPEHGTVWQVQPAGERAAFVALSAPGRVLRVEPGRETTTLFTAQSEALVTAMVSDGRGGVYFGVSPEGRILHADAQGEVRTVSQTPATFIWALTPGAEGTLWAGTGVPGALLRIGTDGDVTTVFETGDDPVRCLAPLPEGGVLLGTGGQGRLVRVDATDRPFVLYDADETEIVSVVRDDGGRIFALTAETARQPRPKAPNQDLAQKIGNAMRVVVTPKESADAPDSAPPKPEPAKPAPPAQGFTSRPGGSVYRVDPDGGVHKIWTAIQELPFAMVLDDEGHLLVATGDAGRVILLDAKGASTHLLRIASNQASAMARGENGAILIGGSTDARVERLGPDRRSSGTYRTQAIDAGTIADWGQLRWDAMLPPGSKLSIEVRSGNTDDPDETWSDWVSLASGNGTAEVQTRVPPARWFQARLDLAARRDERPFVRQLGVAFLPRNRAPVVEQLKVEPAGVVVIPGPVQSSARMGPVVTDDPVSRQARHNAKRSLRGAPPLRRSFESGARTFQWLAADPDGDRLKYRVDIRKEGTAHWFPLVEDRSDSFFSWDARGLPSGYYRVRLTADDSSDNPRGMHLSHQRVSDLFRIDNSRPSVGQLDVRRADEGMRVEFVAQDPGGTVAAVEVALDGAAWRPLNPLDGLADSSEERYRLVVETKPGATDETRALLVRVTDSAGNLGGEMWLLERP